VQNSRRVDGRKLQKRKCWNHTSANMEPPEVLRQMGALTNGR
jgi:hypothetical protein